MKVKICENCEYDVETTSYFCPNCGKQTVVTETGDGDYYVGPGLYCTSCKCQFFMPSCGINEKIEFII